MWIDIRNSLKKFAFTLRDLPPKECSLFVTDTRFSAITAATIKGVHDVQLVEQNVDGDKFWKFIKNSILPILQPFDASNPNSVIVMDNASIHYIEEVSQHVL